MRRPLNVNSSSKKGKNQALLNSGFLIITKLDLGVFARASKVLSFELRAQESNLLPKEPLCFGEYFK